MSVRRGWLASGLLLVVAAPAQAGTAYVVTARATPTLASFSTFAFDTATGRRGDPIPIVGVMAVTPDNRTVYMLNDTLVRPLDTASNTLGAEIPVPPGGRAIAITPDGGTVLVASREAGAVTPIATATHQPGAPLPVTGATDLAITPDGRTAYVLGANHTVTPIDLATRTVQAPIALAHAPAAIAITPDGTLAVVSENDDRAGFVQVIDLASGVPEAPVSLSGQPASDVAMAPDGSTAYLAVDPAAGQQGGVYPFTLATRTLGAKLAGTDYYAPHTLAVGAAGDRLYGSTRCIAGRGCGYGYVFDLLLSNPDRIAYWFGGGGGDDDAYAPGTLVLAPSPAASFTVAVGTTNRPTTFDAVASNNDGGTITGYRWDYGDGQTETTNAARTTYVYRAPGTYTVKLTTTNAGGCASRFVFTGQSAACNGSTTATTTRRVTIVTPGASATTDRAERVSRNAATVFGTVGETVGATDWRFEYGPTTRYGQTTPATRGGGAVQATLAKLDPKTTYHYRLVAATEEGTPPVTYGEDRTFTTSATGTLRLQAKTLRLRGTSVNVALRCVSDVGCRGELKLSSGKRTCATSTIRLKANARSTKRLTVRRTCRKQTSARLTSTVTTGQTDVAATVRVKR